MTPTARKDLLVSIDDVVVRYGDAPVLGGVTAEVRDLVRPGCITGQVVGILGPSGVGKTQLSRVMTGLQEPTSGAVTIGPTKIPVTAGMVGFVAQNYPLLQHRTVLGNLTLAARHRAPASRRAEAEERAMGYLTRFGLDGKRSAYPAELSGGQRQRIAIAQQLLCSEHYLVLDEPTTGLDPIMKDKVCEFIREVSAVAEENTIFVITHDVPSILAIADTLWLLGRTKDAAGQPAGSKVRYTYDLIERGITWEAEPWRLPAYGEVLREIRARFEEL